MYNWYVVDTICEQLRTVTLLFTIIYFPGLIEPCIEPLCSGFSVNRRLNQNLCVPGRCECPEELQFCTNAQGVERIRYREDRGGKIYDEGKTLISTIDIQYHFHTC